MYSIDNLRFNYNVTSEIVKLYNDLDVLHQLVLRILTCHFAIFLNVNNYNSNVACYYEQTNTTDR